MQNGTRILTILNAISIILFCAHPVGARVRPFVPHLWHLGRRLRDGVLSHPPNASEPRVALLEHP